MNIAEFKKLFQRAGKRCEFVGDESLGVCAAPDLEARLYLVFRGEIVSRVNPDAILHYSDRNGYRNPGGDGLWPAPEGSRYGYNYSSGSSPLEKKLNTIYTKLEHLLDTELEPKLQEEWNLLGRI